MAKGLALTIGINSVDPDHYAGWSGKLNACEADANDMAAIARSSGFEVVSLLTAAATRISVISEIRKAASALFPGDIFLLCYAGHGGQLPDLNSDEPDAEDETWCLYDGQLVDDETYAELAKFPPGTRILAFSDSCHSGSVLRLQAYLAAARTSIFRSAFPETQYRFMPPEIAQRVYRNNRNLYDPILQDAELRSKQDDVTASVILISGCQDNQASSDGAFNGLFTSNLLQVWNQGKFRGDYRRFHEEIVRRMPPDQTPNYFPAGQYSREFERQTPFTI